MSHPSSAYIFISYSRRDGDAMQRIVSFLRGHDVNAWVDNEKLVTGTPIWEREIERAIRGAAAVIVILSPDAKESVWVLNELTLADEYKKRVFPVLVAGDFRESVPFRLATRQFVDLRMNESAGLKALNTSVRHYLEEVERLEAERLAVERETAERSEAEQKSREDAARLAAWRAEQERIAEEKRRADLRAKEDPDRISARRPDEERPPITLTKGQKPALQRDSVGQPAKADSAGKESVKPVSSGTTVTLPFSRSMLTWGIIGAIVVCGLGAGIWGISNWLQGLGSSPPAVTEEPTTDPSGVSPPESTEEPPTEPASTEDASLPPFSGTSLVAPNCNYGGLFQSIEATDRYTVTFNLCRSEAAFLSKLAITAFAIYPEEWIQNTISAGARTGDALEHPIGTGPYVVSSWQRGDNITFAANAEYWGDPPAAATLVFRWTSDSAQRLLELQSGIVDAIDNVAATDYAAVTSDTNISLQVRPILSVFYIGMNNQFAPFDDQRVRQAIAMGIDRQRLIDQFYPPATKLATHFTPCAIPNGCVGEDWYPFDPETARALLAEAGYPDGFNTKLYYRDVVRAYLPQANNVAQDIRSQLLEYLNIHAEIEVMESGTFITAVVEGQIDGLYLFGWTGDYPHITGYLDAHFTDQSVEFGNVSPAYANAITNGATVADLDGAQSFYVEANNAIRENVPMVPVAHPTALVAYRSDVTNPQASPLYHEKFASVNPNGRDTFIWMQSDEPASLFCADETDIATLRTCAQVMETLYAYEENGAGVEPSLAENCEPNADLTVWVCHLRQGVHFHDGSTFDANDVVTTFIMGLDASSPLHVGNLNAWDYYSIIWGLMNTP